MRIVTRTIIALAASLAMALGMSLSAQADTPEADALAATALSMPVHDRAVSDVPASWTPHIQDGRVFSLTQVGSTVVAGGSFSQVSQTATSSTMSRTSIVAFSATNGQISTSFNPTVVNGQVMSVIPGPIAGTVFVAGSFTSIAGVSRKVVLLNATTGQPVAGFTAPAINGAVRDLVLVGNRLYVGGTYTTVGGQPHGGLVTLNATTGAREDFLSVQLTENHNYTNHPTGARGAVGARSIAIDANATTLAVIGNFRKADGVMRDQMVLIDITGATAQVRSDWRTRRYEPACAWNAFDTYVRDVTASPDGAYFTVATTGAPNSGTLCDTLARWDVSASGDDVQPIWHDETGGDTLLSAASSGAVVYTGGHQRWQNNTNGADYPAAGSVPRPGLAGFHPDWGLPIEWNPGRNPRGAGAEALLVTDAGLWVGSDTIWIGDRDYRRSRLAFFPLQGGQTVPEGSTSDLPSNVYLGASAAGTAAGDVLFRVNAGGPELAANDGGPDWQGDAGVTSPYRNSGSNAAGWGEVGTVLSDVPVSTPAQVFDAERWDPGDATPMHWSIPVTDGEEILVRLYLANRCDCTANAGARVFNISLDGAEVLSDYDIVADVGHNVGTMKEFALTSDGVVDIEFGHVVENPLINAIEIVKSDSEEEPSTSPPLSRIWYEGGAAQHGLESAPAGDIDWSTVRGAVVIDGLLYYIEGGSFYKRSFDGDSYGAEAVVDPYNDPKWANVDTASGGHTYRGTLPSFYGQMSSVRGLEFEDGLLYYTRAGFNQIFVRKFVPGGDVMSQTVGTVPGFSQSSLGGIFIDAAGGYLYFSNTSTGNLSRMAWNSGSVSGAPVVVSGPAIDGMDWRAGAMFLADGPAPQVNQAPTASFDVSCARLECTFDASGSVDEDGSIADYSWSFGDGDSGSGEDVTHVYDSADEFDVTLTVTDNDDATASATQTIEVVDNLAPVAVVSGSCELLECSFSGQESSDADGSIVDYSWDFGDGSAAGTGSEPDHAYSAPGEYEVTLTVIDDSGSSAAANMVVAVTDVLTEAPELVGSNATNTHSRTSSVAVPDGVEDGDTLLLFVNSGAIDPIVLPTGAGDWELVEETTSGPMSVRVFAHEVDGTEGASVSFVWPQLRKVDLTILAYRNADLSGLVSAEAVAAGETSHPSPEVAVEAGGQVAVSYWADRGSNALTWTAPAGVNMISTQVGTGGGRVSSLVADAEVTSAGTYGGLVATTSAVASRTVYLTILLPGQG